MSDDRRTVDRQLSTFSLGSFAIAVKGTAGIAEERDGRGRVVIDDSPCGPSSVFEHVRTELIQSVRRRSSRCGRVLRAHGTECPRVSAPFGNLSEGAV